MSDASVAIERAGHRGVCSIRSEWQGNAALGAALAGLVALLVASGCVVTSETRDSQLEVSWTLVSGDDNRPTACGAGVATVALVSEPLDDGDALLGDGDETYDLFDCANGFGVTGRLAPGNYDIWIDVLDPSGALVAQSGYQTISLGFDESLDVGFDVSLDRGSFGLTWSLTDGLGVLSCSQVNGQELLVASTLVGPDSTGYDDYFSCVDGQAVTPGLPLGDYDISLVLLDGVGAAMHAPVEIQESLDIGNDFKDLGNFEFQLQE